MSNILLECMDCHTCFTPSEWFDSYRMTNELLEYVSEKRNILPENLSEEEVYEFLLNESARMDCPECGEVQCIEDLCEI